jgi:hypothetical protein
LAHEEQRHPTDTNNHSYQVANGTVLVKNWFEYQQVNRGGVLKKDRVCCGRLFGRQNKQHEQHRIQSRSERSYAIKTKAFFSGNDRDGDHCEEGTIERQLKARQLRPLNEQAAGAPKQRGEENK